MKRKREVEYKYRSVSVPVKLIREIERIVSELGYWPSVTAFVREACLEKVVRTNELVASLRGTGARRVLETMPEKRREEAPPKKGEKGA